MGTSIFWAIAIVARISLPVSLDDAMQKNQISARAVAASGTTHFQQPVLLELKNNTAVSITLQVPVGRLFGNSNPGEQDFISTEPLYVNLVPNETKKVPVSAMCINASKAGPTAGNGFSIKKTAVGKLLSAATYIHDKKLSGSYLGQTVMWCVSDNNPLESIFGYEEQQERDAVGFLSKLLEKPVPPPPAADDYLRNPRVAPKIEVGGSFEFTFSRVKAVQIAMFDEQNIAVRELYNNPQQPPGRQEVNFAFDASVYRDKKYYIRFLCDNRVLMEQEVGI